MEDRCTNYRLERISFAEHSLANRIYFRSNFIVIDDNAKDTAFQLAEIINTVAWMTSMGKAIRTSPSCSAWMTTNSCMSRGLKYYWRLCEVVCAASGIRATDVWWATGQTNFFLVLLTRVHVWTPRWTHEVGRWMLDNNVLILFRRNRFWHSSSSLIRARIYECIWDWYEVIDDVVNATRWRLLNDVDILITYSIVILRRPSTSVLCVHNYVTTAESLQPVCNRR